MDWVSEEGEGASVVQGSGWGRLPDRDRDFHFPPCSSKALSLPILLSLFLFFQQESGNRAIGFCPKSES